MMYLGRQTLSRHRLDVGRSLYRFASVAFWPFWPFETLCQIIGYSPPHVARVGAPRAQLKFPSLPSSVPGGFPQGVPFLEGNGSPPKRVANFGNCGKESPRKRVGNPTGKPYGETLREPQGRKGMKFPAPSQSEASSVIGAKREEGWWEGKRRRGGETT